MSELRSVVQMSNKVDLEPAPDGYPIKLVRDLTAITINFSGQPGDLFYAPLHVGDDHGRWLRRKLIEEVAEYVEGRTLSELCDVLAVVKALGGRCHKRTMSELVRESD